MARILCAGATKFVAAYCIALATAACGPPSNGGPTSASVRVDQVSDPWVGRSDDAEALANLVSGRPIKLIRTAIAESEPGSGRQACFIATPTKILAIRPLKTCFLFFPRQTCLKAFSAPQLNRPGNAQHHHLLDPII
jgi:hypothetical protein